ncbi:MAG: hypothetical protein JXQ82_03850 [Methanomicrobiaceae archaeon]|nr:hypothetical protein [Methanomicrobiaceae archaeon]
MKKILFLAIILGLFAIILSAGCTGNENAAVSGEQTTAQSQAQSSSASGFSLNPTPTDEIPSNLAINVDAEKDPLDGAVTVISRGGPGLYMANKLNVKIYLSTGQIIERNIAPDVNSEALFTEGTKGTDRVVVVASLDNGESYKIFDELLEYRKRTDNT